MLAPPYNAHLKPHDSIDTPVLYREDDAHILLSAAHLPLLPIILVLLIVVHLLPIAHAHLLLTVTSDLAVQ